jgi:hypothetical protein
MEYGLAAQAEPALDGLTFAQASQHVMVVEQRFSRHGLHLKQKFQEQVKQREAEQRARAAEQKLPSIIPEKE